MNPNPESSAVVSVRVPAGTKEALQAIASGRGVSLAELIQGYIAAGLRHAAGPAQAPAPAGAQPPHPPEPAGDGPPARRLEALRGLGAVEDGARGQGPESPPDSNGPSEKEPPPRSEPPRAWLQPPPEDLPDYGEDPEEEDFEEDSDGPDGWPEASDEEGHPEDSEKPSYEDGVRDTEEIARQRVERLSLWLLRQLGPHLDTHPEPFRSLFLMEWDAEKSNWLDDSGRYGPEGAYEYIRNGGQRPQEFFDGGAEEEQETYAPEADDRPRRCRPVAIKRSTRK